MYLQLHKYVKIPLNVGMLDILHQSIAGLLAVLSLEINVQEKQIYEQLVWETTPFLSCW